MVFIWYFLPGNRLIMEKIKIVAAIVCCVFVSSCNWDARDQQVGPRTKLIDVTIDGNTHQYLFYQGYQSIGVVDHWPDCKYCKEKNDEN